MRVVQASGEKEQWILSTSDQPIVSKMTLSETPTFLQLLTFGLYYGTQRVCGCGCRCTTCKSVIVDGFLLLDVPADWIVPTVRGLIDWIRVRLNVHKVLV